MRVLEIFCPFEITMAQKEDHLATPKDVRPDPAIIGMSALLL